MNWRRLFLYFVVGMALGYGASQLLVRLLT